MKKNEIDPEWLITIYLQLYFVGFTFSESIFTQGTNVLIANATIRITEFGHKGKGFMQTTISNHDAGCICQSESMSIYEYTWLFFCATKF